jgi:hypothetical protein
VLHDAPMLIGDGGVIFDLKPIPTQGSHSHRTAERPVNASRRAAPTGAPGPCDARTYPPSALIPAPGYVRPSRVSGAHHEQ